jgi:hypothetical protein
MPPENTDPVAKTEPSEFDFAASQAENPRLKKRSLKGKAPEQPAASTSETPRPSITPDQPRSTTGYTSPSATQAGEPRPTYVRPGSAPAAEKPQPAPSGVLYYSTAPQKDAAPKTNPLPNPASRPATAPTQPASHRPSTPTPMQTPSTSRPASSPQPAPNRPAGASTAGATASRPAGAASSTASTGASATGATRAVSTTVAGPAASSRPGGVSDYRANIDRQTREQKSIGGILNLAVYALIAIFILGAGLAGYGAHIIFKQLNEQSSTVTDLDSRFSTANDQLTTQLKTTQQSLQQLQTQADREQDLALKQQDTIAKLQAALTADTEALRQERSARAAESSARASEAAVLRARVRTLENREQPNYRP